MIFYNYFIGLFIWFENIMQFESFWYFLQFTAIFDNKIIIHIYF